MIYESPLHALFNLLLTAMFADDDNDNPSIDDIFRAAVGEVRPVKNHRHNERAPAPKAVPVKFLEDEAMALEESLSMDYIEADVQPEELLSYRGDGIQQRTFRKLKRGEYRREAEIDLHGLNVEMAHQALNEFIGTSYHRSLRCVHIIHGKGGRSGDEGAILKTRVNTWLRHHSKVLAFHSAPAHEGGTGAVFTLLKSNREID